MKLVKANKLQRGNRVSIDGSLLEVVKVSSTAHNEPHVMILFLNGKSRIANITEDFLVFDTEGETK